MNTENTQYRIFNTIEYRKYWILNFQYYWIPKKITIPKFNSIEKKNSIKIPALVPIYLQYLIHGSCKFHGRINLHQVAIKSNLYLTLLTFNKFFRGKSNTSLMRSKNSYWGTLYQVLANMPNNQKNKLLTRYILTFKRETRKNFKLTPFKNPQRWMGQNTFPSLLLDDDNMIEEH